MKRSFITGIKRAAAAMLAAAMTLCYTGCGENTEDLADGETVGATDEVTTPVTLDPREAISDELPDITYDGADFVLFGREQAIDDYIIEEATADYVDDAIYKRNITVEEKYDIKISAVTMDGDWGNYTQYMNKLITIGMAGDGEFSLVEGDTFIIDLMGHNYFLDWLDFDFIDFEKPWWSQAAVRTQTIGGKLEFVTGDYSLLLWKGLVVMYFNKELAADKLTENLYELVNEHKWTLEKVGEISRRLNEDLNGDSVYDENDLYGLITTTGNCIDNFIVSSDVKMVENDSEGFPVFCYDNERAARMTELVFNLTQSPGVYAIEEEKTEELLEPMFMSGHGLLYTGTLNSAAVFRSMDTDFGMLPYPLLDENQEEYKTFSKGGFGDFAIPSGATNPEMSAVITTALNAESYKKVIPAYYDITLINKSTRDDESGEMLDIIRRGFDFDIACVLLASTDNIMVMLRLMVRNGSYTFASQIAKRGKAVTKKLEQLKENILSASGA